MLPIELHPWYGVANVSPCPEISELGLGRAIFKAALKPLSNTLSSGRYKVYVFPCINIKPHCGVEGGGKTEFRASCWQYQIINEGTSSLIIYSVFDVLICFRIVNIECVVFYIHVFFSFFLVSFLRYNFNYCCYPVYRAVKSVFFFCKIKPRGNLLQNTSYCKLPIR